MASAALIVMLPSSSIEPKSTSPEETGASLTGANEIDWVSMLSETMPIELIME